MKLKSDDRVVDVKLSSGKNVFIATHGGYGLRYSISEVPITGVRSSGVKAISVKNDFVVSFSLFNNEEFLTIITSKNTGKRVHMQEFELASRGRKGSKLIREVKTNPYYILKTFVSNGKDLLGLRCLNDNLEVKMTELPIADRQSTGSVITKAVVEDVYIITDLEHQEEEVIEINEPVSLNTVDEQIMTIDDFLDNFDIGEK